MNNLIAFSYININNVLFFICTFPYILVFYTGPYVILKSNIVITYICIFHTYNNILQLV